MSLVAPSVTLIEFIIGSTAGVVAYVAWQYRDRPAGTPLFAMAVTGMAYAGTSVLASTLTDPFLWEVITGVQYPLTAALAVEAFYVAVEFTQRETYQRQPIRILFAVFILASFSTAVTNPIHHLLNSAPRPAAGGGFTITYQPLFWVHTAIGLTIILFSIALLAVELADSEGIYREQIMAIIGGFLIGILFFLWESIAPVHPEFNLATVGIVGWCFSTLWGVSRVDLLETAPIARKTLVDSMEDAVFALDTENRIVDINPRACDQFNIETEAVGTPVGDVLSEHPPLLKAIESPENRQEITIEEDGRDRYFHVKKSPVYNTGFGAGQKNVQIGQTVVVREITERKQREKELERQNERLDEFVSVVSHDLQNPLSVAKGHTELVRDDCESEHLDAVTKAHNRMEEMIDDLLVLARSGQSIEELEPVELSEVVKQSWQTVETGDATRISDVELTVLADQGRLHQLFENLFRNAVEHAGEDVTITVGQLHDGFYVADDGSGIPKEDRTQVFESGYSTAASGNGFGLRIVKQIVDGHDWQITVTDSEDGGARFEITGVETET
jgi:PAS domain S-box-containing protein